MSSPRPALEKFTGEKQEKSIYFVPPYLTRASPSLGREATHVVYRRGKLATTFLGGHYLTWQCVVL